MDHRSEQIWIVRRIGDPRFHFLTRVAQRSLLGTFRFTLSLRAGSFTVVPTFEWNTPHEFPPRLFSTLCFPFWIWTNSVYSAAVPPPPHLPQTSWRRRRRKSSATRGRHMLILARDRSATYDRRSELTHQTHMESPMIRRQFTRPQSERRELAQKKAWNSETQMALAWGAEKDSRKEKRSAS
jgi:hypothetical protein